MTKSEVYKDSFYQNFMDQNKFHDFLTERSGHAKWQKNHIRDLKVIAFDPESKPVNVEIVGCEDEELDAVLEDTMNNTKLLLRAKKSFYPIRSCAIKTLKDRAEISGRILSKIDKNDFAKILNTCLSACNGDALLKIADGKVSAVHAGDLSDYSVLEILDLFKSTTDYLHNNFSHVEFISGSYDHSLITAMWDLSKNEDLIKNYEEVLERHNITEKKLRPVIKVTTSDTAISGANIYTALNNGRKLGTIPLGSPIKLRHRGVVTIEDYMRNLSLIYSQFEKNLKTIARLLDITIWYPMNCFLSICKELKIRKKLSYEAADLMKNQIGNDKCTAHDIYYSLSEIIFLLENEDRPNSEIVAMEELIARTLSFKWPEYDLPGDFKW